MTRQSSAKLFSRQRKRSLSKDELVYLPALQINKTKHKNIDTLDMTENIAISESEPRFKTRRWGCKVIICKRYN